MIALVAIMQDEAPLVDRWVQGVRRLDGIFSEVVVLDGGSTDGTVAALREHGVRVEESSFSGNFAAQRNLACALVSAPWIFMLDADEVPSTPLLAGLSAICRDADVAKVDSIGVPRLNFIDNQLVASPGYRGLDFQYRINRRHCQWQGHVHEIPIGAGPRLELDLVEGFFIAHMKTGERHAERNRMYQTMAGSGTP